MIEYIILRSDRKTIAIQVKSDGSVTVRAPHGTSERRIRAFVNEKSEWIFKTRKKLLDKRQKIIDEDPIDTDDVLELSKRAKDLIPARAGYYAKLIGVEYGRITVRHQRSRWGSCSARKNLSFNCLLMLTPPEVIDYVVVHELCHIKEMNHSKKFWAEVEKVIPDYKARREWLKKNGNILIERMKMGE